MSDTVLLALISVAGQILVIWFNGQNSRKLLEKTDQQTNELGGKVDAYHKETNSKLSQLVVAEKALSYKEGEANQKSKDETKHTPDTPKESE